MATQSTSTKQVEQSAAGTKAETTEAEDSTRVTLYSADGREKTTTDPSTVVALEFDGWTQSKPKPAKK